jgi:glutathione S-transferase
MKIKLITSGISPYGQRVEMAMIEKNIPYEKEGINLADRPQWFVKDAPLNKVPLLYADGKPLFESIAICEFLEEAFPQNPLHPQDPYMRAWHRGWMEFSSAILAATFGMIFSQNQEQFDLKKAETVEKLTILERHMKFSPYFDGDKFCLVDVCFATAFKPLAFIDNKFALGIFDLHKKVASYAESVTTRGSLSKALPDNYEELCKIFFERRKSHLLNLSFSL